MAVDWAQIGILLGNFGAMAGLVKVYATKVDKHADVLPAMAESLKTTSETQKVMLSSIQELYNSRNAHALAIERLKTTHRIKGCELPKELMGGQDET